LSHTFEFGAAIAGNGSGTRFSKSPSGYSPFMPEPLQLRMSGKKELSLQEALELLESLPSESSDSPTDDFSD
ncbi:hypothetical protein TNCV_1073531, partial [Trichonephila clavipes]